MHETSQAIWNTMVADSKSRGEHNDCTVKALTAATGLPYSDCHAALAKTGRKNRRGCNWIIQGPIAAKALGFNMEMMDFRDYNAKTMITAERDRAFRSGRYVAQVSQHVAAIIDGKVIDWSQGKRKRIVAMYCCTPIPGFQAPEAPMRDPVPAGSATWQSFRKYKKADNLELF